MFNTIMSLFSGIFNLFNKVADHVAKKDEENKTKNKYEQEKKIKALEADRDAAEKLAESKAKTKEAQDAVDRVSNVSEADVLMTAEQIESELADISNLDKREERRKEIEVAKVIKKNADEEVAKIVNSSAFQSGDEITFRG